MRRAESKGLDMRMSKRGIGLLVALLAVAILGLGAPAQAQAAVKQPDQVQTYTDEVIDTFKEFTCGLFRVDRYDIKYKRITYQRTYSSKDTVIDYYNGWYNGYQGQISQHKLIYTLR